MNAVQLKELVLQSLAHERGGVLIYRTALECAENKDLRVEWTKYLSQTEEHVNVLTRACHSLGFDPAEITPGCEIVTYQGKSLVDAMKMALANRDPAAAELVACDCVVVAETKDHANWQLIGECAKAAKGETSRVLQEAYDIVDEEEAEHLYHTNGWCRELALKGLGLEAKLPPPEEEQKVKTASAAAKVQMKRAKEGKALSVPRLG